MVSRRRAAIAGEEVRRTAVMTGHKKRKAKKPALDVKKKAKKQAVPSILAADVKPLTTNTILEPTAADVQPNEPTAEDVEDVMRFLENPDNWPVQPKSKSKSKSPRKPRASVTPDDELRAHLKRYAEINQVYGTGAVISWRIEGKLDEFSSIVYTL
jgi:hypothetical protein